MEGAIAEAPVSTAMPSAPQTAPEANAPATEIQSPVPGENPSLAEKAKAALKEFREKNAPPESKPVTEEQATETKEEKPTEEQAVSTEPLEVISHNGKEANIADVLEDADFEVFAKGEHRPVKGIQKLMDMASIGYAATEMNQTAKEAVIKAQDVIREIEESAPKKAQELANKYLTDLLDKVTTGRINPATNQPYKTEAERARAVELALELKKANDNNAKPKETSMTREEIQKLVEEQAEKKLKATEQQREKQQRIDRITKTASETLQKETEPLMQYFLKEDGKTLNSPLFNTFVKEVKAQADQLFTEADGPSDTAKIVSFIKSAKDNIFNEWKSSLKSEPKKEAAKIPVVGTKSGMPLPQPNAPAKKYGSYQESVEAKLAEYRRSKQATRV